MCIWYSYNNNNMVYINVFPSRKYIYCNEYVTIYFDILYIYIYCIYLPYRVYTGHTCSRSSFNSCTEEETVLVFINRDYNRRTFDHIRKINIWKGLVLLLAGVVGGMFTSFAGSGIDICTFSVLTLLYRLSEKVATPTSVILMAINSVVGMYWRGVVMQDISQEAWEFMVVCAPIVVIGAPVGAFLGSHFHRLVLAAAVVIADAAALIGAYVIVEMTSLLIGVSVGLLIGGMLFFALLSYCGHRMLQNYTDPEAGIQNEVSTTNYHQEVSTSTIVNNNSQL